MVRNKHFSKSAVKERSKRRKAIKKVNSKNISRDNSLSSIGFFIYFLHFIVHGFIFRLTLSMGPSFLSPFFGPYYSSCHFRLIGYGTAVSGIVSSTLIMWSDYIFDVTHILCFVAIPFSAIPVVGKYMFSLADSIGPMPIVDTFTIMCFGPAIFLLFWAIPFLINSWWHMDTCGEGSIVPTCMCAMVAFCVGSCLVDVITYWVFFPRCRLFLYLAFSCILCGGIAMSLKSWSISKYKPFPGSFGFKGFCICIFFVACFSAMGFDSGTYCHYGSKSVASILQRNGNYIEKKDNYGVLDRVESLTGFLAVIEETSLDIRVLKCDHSVLGGKWNSAGDSIFGVFYIQEAVRLVKTENLISPSFQQSPNQHALVIGLGIGTTASGLMAHGIQLDIVEIDPQVVHLAKKFFGFSPRKQDTVITSDIFPLLQAGSTNTYLLDGKYNFILHDVFTGGSMPIALFTKKFFIRLAKLLRPKSGVLALNFYGSVTGGLTLYVYATLQHVFNSVRCFRDEHNDDMANIVFFASMQERIIFRSPQEKDFLGSNMRQRFLEDFTKWEIFFQLPEHTDFLLIKDDPNEEISLMMDKITQHHWSGIREVFPQPFWTL